jgi:prepilin-type N-terminal cleavage/methylation domain-containing protein
MSPKNKKGMTLMEMMVVVIIIVGLVLAAYPTYLSSLEKARAQEAVQLISHLAAAQDKFMAECYSMNASTGECYYSSDFSKLPIDIGGPNKKVQDSSGGGIEITGNTMITPGYTYKIDGSMITATPQRDSYKYTITANMAGSEILCNTSGDKSGKKICSAIGKATPTTGVYKID